MLGVDLEKRLERIEQSLVEIYYLLEKRSAKVDERRFAKVHFAPADPIPFNLLLDRTHR